MAEQTPMIEKLQARHAQLVAEHQTHTTRIEVARQQLVQLEEADIGYRYVIGELERLIKAEQEQDAAEPVPEKNIDITAHLGRVGADMQAATESDTGKAVPPKRSRAPTTRGGPRRAR